MFMTLLPDSLRQYLPMIIAAQIILFASAILVGGFLIIRRLSRRPPMDGQMMEEKEKLAGEIHAEILRLQELRDRLFDGFSDSNATTFSSKMSQQSPIVGTAANSSAAQALAATAAAAGHGPTANEAELAKNNEQLKLQIETLKKEMALLQAGAPAGALAPDKIEELRESIKKTLEPELSEKFRAEAKEKLNSQETTIKDLRNRLEEYEIFEEELAQIKKYKIENEQLKQQVSVGGPAMTPAFSEDDIAQLFNEMSTGGLDILQGAPAAVAPQAAPALQASTKTIIPGDKQDLTPVKTVIPASPAPEKAAVKEIIKDEPLLQAAAPAPAAEPSLDDELEKFLASSENLSDAMAASPSVPQGAPAGFEAEKRSAEPDVVAVDSDNAEALAMLGGDQDELMREFEKVLAPNEKDK